MLRGGYRGRVGRNVNNIPIHTNNIEGAWS